VLRVSREDASRPSPSAEDRRTSPQRRRCGFDHVQWYLALLHSGRLPHAREKTPYVALTRALTEDAMRRVPRLRDLSDVALRNFLTDQEAMGVEIKKHRTSSANGWKFPLLSECRDAWCKRYGPTQWDTQHQRLGR
jgi:hypothetical protein